MSTYSVEELARLWRHEQITAEQAIGHLVQHIQILHEEVAALRRAAGQGRKLDERLQRLERAAEAAMRVLSKPR